MYSNGRTEPSVLFLIVNWYLNIRDSSLNDSSVCLLPLNQTVLCKHGWLKHGPVRLLEDVSMWLVAHIIINKGLLCVKVPPAVCEHSWLSSKTIRLSKEVRAEHRCHVFRQLCTGCPDSTRCLLIYNTDASLLYVTVSSWWRACCLQNTTRCLQTSARPRPAPRGRSRWQSSRTTPRAKRTNRKQRARGRVLDPQINLPSLVHFPFPLCHNPPVLSSVVSRTSLQSRTAICQRTKERPATLRRKQANRRKHERGSKKERKTSRLTSWIPKCPREC